LTNQAGVVTDTYDYDAFGNKLNSTGSTPNNYLYRGEQYDPDLGLYYLRARYYNPLTGRFLSRDPDDHGQMDPNQLHKYLYADGDPANGVDPTGRGSVGLRLQGAALEYALVTTLVIHNVTRYVFTYGPAICKAVKWLSWGKTAAGVFQVSVPQLVGGLIDAIRQFCSSIL
jgi:RHS repeat-associated protein